MALMPKGSCISVVNGATGMHVYNLYMYVCLKAINYLNNGVKEEYDHVKPDHFSI